MKIWQFILPILGTLLLLPTLAEGLGFSSTGLGLISLLLMVGLLVGIAIFTWSRKAKGIEDRNLRILSSIAVLFLFVLAPAWSILTIDMSFNASTVPFLMFVTIGGVAGMIAMYKWLLGVLR